MNRRYSLREPKYDAPQGTHYLVAVDLGKRKVGAAVFWVDPANDVTLLVRAATVLEDDGPHAMATAIYDVAPDEDVSEAGVYWVCEWPMKYADKRKYHEAIEDLHAVGDAMGMLIRGWDERYRPGEWKGNVPKRAHHKRLSRALRDEERAVAPNANEHDAWDAIGIGLFALARTKRGGVLFK